MAVSQKVKSLCVNLIKSQEDLVYLTAHFILRDTVGLSREMAIDKGNDSETRANYMLALVDKDHLVECAQDGIYSMMLDDFFTEVSEEMVKLAKDYVTPDPLKTTR